MSRRLHSISLVVYLPRGGAWQGGLSLASMAWQVWLGPLAGAGIAPCLNSRTSQFATLAGRKETQTCVYACVHVCTRICVWQRCSQGNALPKAHPKGPS
jgi:hypothetical protein